MNELALKLVKPGGLLCSFTCSGSMTSTSSLLPILTQAGEAAGRTLSLVKPLYAGADHPAPAASPEYAYLSGYMLCVH